MSSGAAFSTAFDGDSRRSRAAGLLFGDRVGLAAFLAALALFVVLWIVDWRINDSLTLLNVLDGMSQGKLHAVEAKYGGSLETPGTHRIGEHVYGRNYGILTLSLIPLALFEGLAVVADLRIAVAGLFSLGVLALALVVGRILDRRRRASRIGAVVAIALFVANVALATDLDPTRTELYALQVTHAVAAAFVVVLAYRLLAAVHGRRAGLFGAGLIALGTPVGLWATVPKRHVFTAALVLLLGLALYRSRVCEREEPGAGLRYRAGAYAAIGIFAWVHAPEALIVLLCFAVVDLPTARNDVRSLATIAVALAVATVPFLVTNYLISGSPVTPPRMLSGAGPSTGEPSFGDGGGVGGTGIVGTVVGLFDPMLRPLTVLASLYGRGIDNVLAQPGEVWATFVHTGYLENFASYADYESVNLAVLESAPLLAATLGVVPAVVGRLRRRAGGLQWPPTPTPVRVLDAYLILFAVAFSLVYLSRLPIHAQITVRYLLPIFPALVVLIVRLPVVRGVLDGHWRLLGWTYAAGVLIGGQLVVVALAFVNPGVGEAFQFHAWIALGVAAPLALWSLVGRADGWWGRAGAVLLGLATAAITVFLLMLTLDYFTVGNSQALPLVRVIGDVVSIV